MAEFRALHIKIWQDEWFSELEPDAKLLFVYLCTNRAVSICGMYRLAPKFISFETGIASKRVSTLMSKFQKDGKARYENGIVWVKNLRKYQTYDGKANEKVKKRIQTDIDDISDCQLKTEYLAYEKKQNRSGIPMQYPSDTHAIPMGERDTLIPDTYDTLIPDSESDTGGADAPKNHPTQHDLGLVVRQIFEHNIKDSDPFISSLTKLTPPFQENSATHFKDWFMDVYLKNKSASQKVLPTKKQITELWPQAFSSNGANAKLDPSNYSGWEAHAHHV